MDFSVVTLQDDDDVGTAFHGEATYEILPQSGGVLRVVDADRSRIIHFSPMHWREVRQDGTTGTTDVSENAW